MYEAYIIKLMLKRSKLKELPGGSSTKVTSHNDCLLCIMNNPLLPECHLEYCPGEQNLMEILTDFFEL
jgi:hypothetical protein